MNDTSPEAQSLLTRIYRQMPLAQKGFILQQMYATGRALHAAGVRQQHPNATDAEIRDAWLAATLDPPLLETLRVWRRQHGR